MLDLPSPVAFLESEYEQACGQCEPVDRQQYPIAAQEHPAEAQEKGHGNVPGMELGMGRGILQKKNPIRMGFC